MNDNQLKSILDLIQNFILIKQQNSVIHCWMQLKKRNKKIILQSSRAKSQYNGTPSLKNSNNKSQKSHCFQPPHLNSNNNTKIPLRSKGFPTQHYIRNSKKSIFDTLNKHSNQSNCDKTEKQAYEPEYPRQSQHPPNEDSNQDEEFQDIVIERLSKLQENINQLMRQKKVKQKRSQCSTPLSNFLHKRQVFFQQLQTPSQTRKDIINNFKYIPVDFNYKPNANIQKIRNIIQNKTQQQNLIDNVDYFVGNNIRSKNEQILYKQPLQKENTSRQKNDRPHYLKGYGACKTVRNNLVHYLPNNLQMLSVIEPRSRFFSRKTDNIKIQEQQKKSNPRSNASRLSEYSTKRNNFSSYN